MAITCACRSVVLAAVAVSASWSWTKPSVATAASSCALSAKCRYGAAALTPARRATSRSVNPFGPFSCTSLRAARRAGVSAAAPYRHFADKAQLLAAVATLGFVQLHEALTATAAKTTDLHAQVIAMGRTYVRWAITHADYYQV